ncbi:MAG TPA: hypothetical protein VNO21_22815, partial [Polyangiaceae bacterium]|nr:hypothetical protein [Polyangiaceae bacterium]
MFRFSHAQRVLFPLLAFTAPALAGSAACSWSDTVDHVTVPTPDAGGPAAVARFVLASGATTAPDYLDVPFPTDAYLSNGRVAVPGIAKYAVTDNGGGAAFLTHDLSVLNGFSRTAMAVFSIDDPVTGKPADIIAPASLPATETACVADGSSVFLIDLEATDASKARVTCRAQYHSNGAGGSRAVVGVGPARGIVLEEGHKYAAVLTSRVKVAAGGQLGPSADFDRVRKGDRTGAIATLYGGAYDKANTALQSALASDGAQIVALAPFTTNAMTSELYALRDAIYAPT